jgi:hypothetical protein
METELMSVAGGAAGGAVAVAITTGDAMCMVMMPAEPPVVKRHMAVAAMVAEAASMVVAVAAMAAGAGKVVVVVAMVAEAAAGMVAAGTEPRN